MTAPFNQDTDKQVGLTHSKAQMQHLLESWANHGWLRQLDTALANFLWREVPDASPLLILAAAFIGFLRKAVLVALRRLLIGGINGRLAISGPKATRT